MQANWGAAYCPARIDRRQAMTASPMGETARKLVRSWQVQVMDLAYGLDRELDPERRVRWMWDRVQAADRIALLEAHGVSEARIRTALSDPERMNRGPSLGVLAVTGALAVGAVPVLTFGGVTARPGWAEDPERIVRDQWLETLKRYFMQQHGPTGAQKEALRVAGIGSAGYQYLSDRKPGNPGIRFVARLAETLEPAGGVSLRLWLL
jgi:hypothetical protein